MKTPRKPTTAAAVTPPAENRGPADTAAVLSFFWNTIDASSLSASELEWLGNASLSVQTMAAGLSATLRGFGNLLSATENGVKQIGGTTVEQVLWAASDTLDTIAALEFIASEAEFELRHRMTRSALSRVRNAEESSQEVANAS